MEDNPPPAPPAPALLGNADSVREWRQEQERRRQEQEQREQEALAVHQAVVTTGCVHSVERALGLPHADIHARAPGLTNGTALHAAASQGSVPLTRLLLQHGADRNARDRMRSTPLHHASAAGSLAVVRELVEGEWKADYCGVPNFAKRTPFDEAVRNHQTAVADYFLEYYKNQLVKQHGDLALHVLLSKDQAVFQEIVGPVLNRYARTTTEIKIELSLGTVTTEQMLGLMQSILKERPNSGVARRGTHGDLPIHTICRRQGAIPPALLRFLFQQDPHCLSQAKTLKGWLPLHVACSNRVSRDTLQFLLQHHRQAIQTPTTSGNRPLHIACRNGASLEVVQCLVRADRAAGTQIRNARGSLALHIACHSSATLRVIEYLATTSPSTCRQADGAGALPIHLACRSGFPVRDLVRILVPQQQNDDAANSSLLAVRDRKGALPIHYYLSRSEVTLPVVQHLVELYPQAVAEPVTSSGFLPYMVAACNNASLDVVNFLVRGYLGWNADLNHQSSNSNSSSANSNENSHDNNPDGDVGRVRRLLATVRLGSEQS